MVAIHKWENSVTKKGFLGNHVDGGMRDHAPNKILTFHRDASVIL